MREIGAQIEINPAKGLTLEKAVRKLEHGILSNALKLPNTAKTILNKNIKNLKTLAAFEKKRGIKNPFAQKLLDQFYRAETNFWQLSNAMYRYGANPAKYDSSETKSEFTNIFEGFQKDWDKIQTELKR